MDAFAKIVLVIFIIIRVLIALGLLYLIYYEVRRLKKGRIKKEEERYGKENTK
jgi:hypothetical protein